MRPLHALFVPVMLLAACGSATSGTPLIKSETKVELTPILEDSEFPWGLAFLDDGSLLFTEKENGLKFLAPGGTTAHIVGGVPQALTRGQGGYMGLTLAPDFAQSRHVYLAYSKGEVNANATAVIRGTLSADNRMLENVEEIFLSDPRGTALHFGSRLQFANDGTLFVSLGDAFRLMQEAQNPANTHGTIVRINADGSIPSDNPFADGVDGHPAVWSYGHRNVQGLYYDPKTDTLYETEHGPKGGDELNISRAGENYGWPKVTYGVNYDGTIISDATEGEGFTSPEMYWVPSIAPSGLTKLTSDIYPEWTGDLFTGGMNGPAGLELTRIDLEDGEVVGRESLFDGEYSIRDVVQGPDGYLYVATKDLDGIFRVDPVTE